MDSGSLKRPLQSCSFFCWHTTLSPSSCQALSIVSTFSTRDRDSHPIVTVKKLLTLASAFPILLAPLSISVLATSCHLRHTASFITASFLLHLLDRVGSLFNQHHQHHHDLIRTPILLLHSSNYEHTLLCLQRLALPSHLESSPTSPALFSATLCSGLSSHKVRYSPPSSHSYFKPNNSYADNTLIIIDTFAPWPLPLDLSPTFSASSDLDSTSSHSPTSKSSFGAFFATRSRVVRVSGAAEITIN